MARSGVNGLNLAGVIVTFLSVVAVVAAPLPGFGQTIPQIKSITPQFIAEPGSPVEVTGSKVDLEVDAFDAPIAARVYLDYRNVGDKTISAVKFRVGYLDGEGKVRGTFHAPDNNVVGAGSSASQKWRGERVDPRTRAVKIRALQVKFSDGSIWQSSKMTNVVTPQTTDTTSGAGQAAANEGAAESGEPAEPASSGGGAAAPSTAIPSSQTPQAGSAGAQSWGGVGSKSLPAAGAAPEAAPQGDAAAEPATGEAATYESVLKTNKRFGTDQGAEDTSGPASYDTPPAAPAEQK